MKLRVSLLAAVLALCISPLRSQELGVIEFPTSGSPAAQPLFIKGVLLMHSFEYDDAREAFVEAEKAEPGFAMAYWGEAMTFNHPIWQQTSPDLAKAALGRLAATPEARRAKARTEREKDWLGAVEKLYGAGDKLARDDAYDDPAHAPLGLKYADAYAKIAPAASHALHMPSHIYVAMGMWDESASINERSMTAADERRDARKLDVDQRGFHAMLWLVYSYAEQGRIEE